MAENLVEIIAFVVVIAVLWRYVKPLVQKMVGDRQEQIQQQVDASEEATRKLDEARERFEKAEVDARKEVARIRDDARADATRISEELQEQADREVERIRQRGQEQLAAQRDQMTRGLRAEVGGQAMALAERVVVDLLADETRRSATVDRFLEDLDTMTSERSASSQNATPTQTPAQAPVQTVGGAS